MENLNEKYPMTSRIKIKKRGRKNWNCVFYDDNPNFFNVLELAISYEQIQKITDNGYIPF